jgi:hypothetical protein
MSWYTEIIQKDPRYQSIQACYDPALLFPPFRAVCDAIIASAAALGHTLKYGETMRSHRREQYLISKGLSKLPLGSKTVHEFGLAADFELLDPNYDGVGEHYQFLLYLCQKHPCPWGPTVSGINWSNWSRPITAQYFHDWDHIQGCTLDQQPELFRLEWYPQS